MFLSRGTYKWMDFGDRHVYLQLSEVKALNENGLNSPCRKLVAVVTSHHSGSEKWQAESLAIR
jgi:hypothetical protein